MENPEEILHSLEEFAKMKPKDIPRELEEYLKFVAKTGDPVYQWSAIKSLFREKLINVITEFYESCSSMEIPPCPNVEMFNYELMKNFILEKLDTFAAAPFTLQRICELLTSPKKEYSRIDKYMRALEKNILVVSTMEPGGRRTENGDGVMNGIESDHEHVPEPGNEINVEEMDDSPSWPQNVQTNNHISEPISFDNTEHEYHVSSSNQEIVCVQYVPVEPLASESLPVQSDEVNKESDISVTITALNVKKGDENQEDTSTPEPESQPTSDVPKEAGEEITKQETENEVDIKMDTQTVEPIENTLRDTGKIISSSEVPSEPFSEDILSSTTNEKSTPEIEHAKDTSLEPENAETESVSPETSITSSEPTTTNESIPITDIPSDDLKLDNTSNSIIEAPEDKLESRVFSQIEQKLEPESSTGVDSSTESSEDNIVTDDTKASGNNDAEIAIPEVETKEEASLVEENTEEADSSLQYQETLETKTSKLSDETPKTETPNEVPTQQETPQIDKPVELPLEEPSKSEELTETNVNEPVEPTSGEMSMQKEKETPMEVDVVPADSSDATEKEEATDKELETSEPPV